MSATHYEKLLLSRQDLTHVYEQLINAAQSKISQALPLSGPHDSLRIQVENQVIEDLTQVFEHAKLAFIIDGNDMAESQTSIQDLLSLQPVEEVVPFDTELNKKLRSVLQNVELETTEVTRLRRELPQQARDAYESLVTSTDQEVTAVVSALSEHPEPEELEPFEQVIPDHDVILSELAASIQNLQKLKNILPAQRAQLDTLTDTAEFLEKVNQMQREETR